MPQWPKGSHRVATTKLSPGVRFLSLRDVKQIFSLASLEDARLFVEALNVPLLVHDRPIPDPPSYAPDATFTEERVLAMALEMSLFAHLSPGGPGLNLPFLADPEANHSEKPPHRLATPAWAANNLNGAFASLDYWERFRLEPMLLQLMIGLSALMYGPWEERDLKNRLQTLGTLILRKSRGAMQPRRKPKPPKQEETRI